MILERVISGGQTGVDQAALYAAQACGIPTGGWMPSGWRTLEGPRPEFEGRFGMREMPAAGYRERTWQNAGEADVTMRIAFDFFTPGERCTRRGVELSGKRLLDIDLREDPKWYLPEDVARQLVSMRVRVLNVAGNSHKTAPGIFRFAKAYLIQVFSALR